MFQPNALEVAWAAGFFDGEGTIGVKRTNHRCLTPQVRIVQIDPRVLHRFNDALGGLGRVNGPYPQKNPRWSPKWQWAVTSLPRGQAVIALMWRFLSPVKREQALGVLRECRAMRQEVALHPYKRPPRQRCPRGHDYSEVYVRNGVRRCMPCRRIREANYAERT